MKKKIEEGALLKALKAHHKKKMAEGGVVEDDEEDEPVDASTNEELDKQINKPWGEYKNPGDDPDPDTVNVRGYEPPAKQDMDNTINNALDPSSPELAQDEPNTQQDLQGSEIKAKTPDEIQPSSKEYGEGAVQSEQVPPPTAPQLSAEDALWQKDLQNGHITPETYQSLFAKKDTLGKIGTIFGALLSGAGSGLAHQPNVLMEMLNKTLTNDLDAQKSSKHNVLNYANASLHHAQTALSYENANIAHTTYAMNKMRLAAIQDLTNTVDKIPDGPYSAAARAALGQVAQGAQAANDMDNQKVAGQMAVSDAIKTVSGPPKANELYGIDFDKFNKAKLLGQLAPWAKGAMQPAQLGAATQEAAKVQENRAFASMYDHAFKALDTLTAGQGAGMFAGSAKTLWTALTKGGRIPLDEDGFNQLRAAEISTLGNAMARATTGRYNREEAESQMNGLFPDWRDTLNGKMDTRTEKYDNAMKWFSTQEAGTPTLDQLRLKGAFPDYRYSATPQGKESNSTRTDNKKKLSESTDSGKAGVGVFQPESKKPVREDEKRMKQWEDEEKKRNRKQG